MKNTNKKMKRIMLLLMFMLLSPLCTEKKTQETGGACSYKSFEGTCTVTRVVATTGVYVSFKYQPTKPMDLTDVGWVKNESDITAREAYTPASHLRLECLRGLREPAFIDMERCGVKEGAAFRCVLELETMGTCSPAIYWFYEKVKG